MHLEDFITRIFCWVDAHCTSFITSPLRQRGKQPKLSDSELLTMEIVGEFLSFDTDKSIWWYFKTHWLSLFPQLPSRSQFAKQALNLCGVKQRLLQPLFSLLRNETVHIIDGFPLPVTHFKQATLSKNVKGESNYGYCASKGETYFGFKDHILITLKGEIAGFYHTPANGSEREVALLPTEDVCGMLLGDKGYLRQSVSDALAAQDVKLVTPVKGNMKDTVSQSWRTKLNAIRRKVETTIGQLTEQFQIEKTKARVMHSLVNRLARKILSYSLGCLFNKQDGEPVTQLSKILAMFPLTVVEG